MHGDVLGNVFTSNGSDDQHAVFEYVVGDAGSTDEWKWQEPVSGELAQVQFYDDACGQAYVSTASEISYRPSALELLDQLGQVCDAVCATLDEKLQENTNSKASMPVVHPDTAASAFLASLTGQTTKEQLDVALAPRADISTDLGDAIQTEAQLKSSDPAKERQRLNNLATDYRTVAAYCKLVFSTLSIEGLQSLAKIRKSALELRAAAKIASSDKFSEEPLDGVGSETWRTLWQAAKAYSETEAYTGHDFPHVEEESRCVLCHQVLDEGGAERLSRFHTFMTETTEEDAKTAEGLLQAKRAELAKLHHLPASISASLTRLTIADDLTATKAEECLQKAVDAAVQAVEWIDSQQDDPPAALVECSAAALTTKGDELTKAALAIDSGTFRTRLANASAAVKELQSQTALVSAAESVRQEVSRLALRTTIEKAKRSTDTGVITRKTTELTKEHVTRVVRDKFTRETERLRLTGVTLDPQRGKKNTLPHLPALVNTTSRASVTDVLSEGEKTALGLAGFFTEVAFDETRSAVVLDDPITSLDHGRRSIVARRIVELAEDRQVVVFTHDISFVGDIVKHADEFDVPVARRWISRQKESTGYCLDGHPWTAKDVSTRIRDLKTEAARIAKDRKDLNPEEYDRRCSAWAGDLSTTWERAVNLEIVYQVVDRGTAEVRPKMFKLLAAITQQDNDEFQQGYSHASKWTRRHDQDPETNYTPPEPEELESEISRLDVWFKRVRKYRS
ncbi:AAA family ATPase [Pseudarthrobacter sp. PH31-O2]|uniref:AAA family ATPase n=1 Tax=Pseudarthrobacter sp. PH31-O2 TaxID=3046206 RepID=UPI0024BB9D74|nr:AAA family ATPase [Pseudarthrobacter sp. PH31-O2]MDJ0354393.1 AAA family ATPase [Pseudarthrobacter sp. PH31-O2]